MLTYDDQCRTDAGAIGERAEPTFPIWNGGSVMTDLSTPQAIGIHVLRINDGDETPDTPTVIPGREGRWELEARFPASQMA